MQDQIKEILLPTFLAIFESNLQVNVENVCCGGTPFYSDHRMGYDGQNKVLPIEYAFLLLRTMLSLSSYRNKNPTSNTETQCHV